jgi:hypothetical protein
MNNSLIMLPEWRPQSMQGSSFLADLLDAGGVIKASAGGSYADLYTRDAMLAALGIYRTHPEPCITALCTIGQFTGVESNLATNELLGANPHQVHREFNNGLIAPDDLIAHSRHYAAIWGIPLQRSPYLGEHFAVYNTSDGQCLPLIVAALIHQRFPELNVLGRRYRHWATGTTRCIADLLLANVQLIATLIEDSDLGLYELPNTNPHQTSPSGVLLDGIDAYWNPDSLEPVRWQRVAYSHNQVLAFLALNAAADLFPDHPLMGHWRDLAQHLRTGTIDQFRLRSGMFPPTAIDRLENGRTPHLIQLQSIATLGLLNRQFLDGLDFAPDLVRVLTDWLFSPEVMTPVGARCQPTTYAHLEGDYHPYQGSPAVWAILNWLVAQDLFALGLAPQGHYLSVLCMLAGMDRTGSSIESWLVDRFTCDPHYDPHGPATPHGRRLAAAERPQKRQTFSASSGYDAFQRLLSGRGYELPTPGTWQYPLALDHAERCRQLRPPAACGEPSMPFVIDLEHGQWLKQQRALRAPAA